jgi:hypothetical protein
LRVFENRVLRRIFGLKRDEVTGGWRKLYKDGLCDLYSSRNIIRMIKSRMRWVGHLAQIGNERNSCWLLVGNPERNGLLGSP